MEGLIKIVKFILYLILLYLVLLGLSVVMLKGANEYHCNEISLIDRQHMERCN